MLIHLIRHASHDEVGKILSGRSGIALNAQGRSQLRLLKARVERERIGAVHSSPQPRAWQTAEAIACSPVVTVDALDEIDFGAWAGRSFAALHADPAWQEWNHARATATPPGGESMAAAAARAIGHIETCAAQGDEPIAMVSHADIVRAVVAHYLGLTPDRMTGFDIDPASISTISAGPWGGRVVCVNERMA